MLCPEPVLYAGTTIGHNNFFEDFCSVREECMIGNNCFISRNVFVKYNTEIENDIDIMDR